MKNNGDLTYKEISELFRGNYEWTESEIISFFAANIALWDERIKELRYRCYLIAHGNQSEEYRREKIHDEYANFGFMIAGLMRDLQRDIGIKVSKDYLTKQNRFVEAYIALHSNRKDD